MKLAPNQENTFPGKSKTKSSLPVEKLIQQALVRRVNRAKGFSVLADETCDISGTEQLSIGVRYVDCGTAVLREDFLSFLYQTRLGKGCLIGF